MKTRIPFFAITCALVVWASYTTARTDVTPHSRFHETGDVSMKMARSPDRPTASIEDLRVWTRSWQKLDMESEKPLVIPLRFSFVAAKWQTPEGGIRPATGTDQDIIAEGYDANVEIMVGEAKQVEIELCGQALIWEAGKQVVNGRTPLPAHNGKLVLRAVADRTSFRMIAPDGGVILSSLASPQIDRPELKITARGGSAKLASLDVFGLRSPNPTPEEARLAARAAVDNRIFFKSHSYTVYGGRVEDRVYGPPVASVPDADTIVSPTRVIEGFNVGIDVWRLRPQARVIDHQTLWHPSAGIRRFPVIKTRWPTVDAACRVALDVLQRCSTEEFAHGPQEVGLWQSGFFMGQGAGFGIWMRDSTHVALRCGNLLDPEAARRTLLYTARSGIDNGVDGVVMPIVGFWDYYLLTGDAEPIRETWQNLKGRIAKLEAQFDESHGLVKAAHSTSNDAFPEPEAGGFALGTETYFMLGFRAMAAMGRMMKEDPSLIKAWETRGNLLGENIRKRYWKDSAGFFTTGPQGSDGYAEDFWESSGQELAIWPRFHIASPEQRRRVLDRLPQVAMNEFGVNVFPYRKETNHFCNAGWVVWTAGMAAAASREGRLDLLEAMIGQQVRNAVTMKTFYEVIDYKSGRAWRWPGQLWQAAGFLSYFYLGVLGMEYDERGLTLHPAVPRSLADLEISNFHYRKAALDIKVKGWGTRGSVFLDGKPVQILPASLEGRHRVEIRAAPKPVDRTHPALKLTRGVGSDPPVFRQPGAVECETMKVVAKSGDIYVGEQDMSPWGAENWSNGRHLVVKANAIGDFVEIECPAPDARPRQLTLYATQAPDFGTLRLSVNGQKVNATLDGYAPIVRPSRAVLLGVFAPRDGKFVLRAEVIGANPAATGPKYFFGLDCVRLLAGDR